MHSAHPHNHIVMAPPHGAMHSAIDRLCRGMRGAGGGGGGGLRGARPP
eukprot:COSAG03_NODE_7521_length_906_cov_0.733581_2_plen_47_part_01